MCGVVFIDVFILVYRIIVFHADIQFTQICVTFSFHLHVRSARRFVTHDVTLDDTSDLVAESADDDVSTCSRVACQRHQRCS